MKTIKRINEKIYNLDIIKYIFLMVTLSFVMVMIFDILIVLIIPEKEFYVEDYSSKIDLLFIIEVVLIGPFIETIIFQKVIVDLLQKIKYLKHKKVIIILISSIIFGLSHCYTMVSIINASLIGLLLAYTYIIYKEKNQHPVLTVTVIHIFRNLISALLYKFFI